MKTNHFYRIIGLAGLIITIFSVLTFGQNSRPLLGILNVYKNSGIAMSGEDLGNLLRAEFEKLDAYSVIDRWDIQSMMQEKQLSSDCISRTCLVETGKSIGAEKMVGCSVELILGQIVITIRIVDVSSGIIERTWVAEYLDLQPEIKTMLNMTVSGMFGKPVDESRKTTLTKKFNYDNSINNPKADRLNCSGPRMGITAYTGSTAAIMMDQRENGGFDCLPLMFQFGYQFEQQYLNEGNFQALFEFIPMVTGLDQGRFIPSFTILNGLRNNSNGWEFAFGPTVVATRRANGYYENGIWTIWDPTDTIPSSRATETRLDSRGQVSLSTGFVFAFGKTIKSGKLNIPFNAYIIPNKEGIRFGVSFGYNTKNR